MSRNAAFGQMPSTYTYGCFPPAADAFAGPRCGHRLSRSARWLWRSMPCYPQGFRDILHTPHRCPVWWPDWNRLPARRVRSFLQLIGPHHHFINRWKNKQLPKNRQLPQNSAEAVWPICAQVQQDCLNQEQVEAYNNGFQKPGKPPILSLDTPSLS